MQPGLEEPDALSARSIQGIVLKKKEKIKRKKVVKYGQVW